MTRDPRSTRPESGVGPAFHATSAGHPAGPRELVIRDGADREIGKIEFRICRACGTGHVDSVTVAPSWQGQGLAREALHRILPDDLALAWTTSRQTGEGRAFFAAVTEETGIGFPAGQPGCVHLRGGGRAGTPPSDRP
ncbi:GNAT superfamily N-acetyltransferase [Streptomyces sp. DSM 41037]|uniref:GNAT family N-acetyltransferase n=1 Tax=Streptomyces sp. DSM 41037 TaxID=2817710 RepID=UPI00277F7526|nr:GNAT family N-acetyltransferase [Streptomyces sp. DSM 41037]MDQ0294406.1 GNAT superfamily N-acetyltransferase [Streptomyces sp. DSM 41037]